MWSPSSTSAAESPFRSSLSPAVRLGGRARVVRRFGGGSVAGAYSRRSVGGFPLFLIGAVLVAVAPGCGSVRPPTPSAARLSPLPAADPPALGAPERRPGRRALLPEPWVISDERGTTEVLFVLDGEPPPSITQERVGGGLRRESAPRLRVDASWAGTWTAVLPQGSLRWSVGAATAAPGPHGPVEVARREIIPLDPDSCGTRRWPAPVGAGVAGCAEPGVVDTIVSDASKRRIETPVGRADEDLRLFARWSVPLSGGEGGILAATGPTILWTPSRTAVMRSPWRVGVTAPVQLEGHAVWVRKDRVEVGPIDGSRRSVFPVEVAPALSPVARGPGWTAVAEGPSARLVLLADAGPRGVVPGLDGVRSLVSTASWLLVRTDELLFLLPWAGGRGRVLPFAASALGPVVGDAGFWWSQVGEGGRRELWARRWDGSAARVSAGPVEVEVRAADAGAVYVVVRPEGAVACFERWSPPPLPPSTALPLAEAPAPQAVVAPPARGVEASGPASTAAPTLGGPR